MWQKEPPTEEGYYWFRAIPNAAPWNYPDKFETEIVLLMQPIRGADIWYARTFDDEQFKVNERAGEWWSERIKEPTA